MDLSHPAPPRFVAFAQAAVLAALPSGGQRVARRNAWAGRSAGAARLRARREADDAVEQAQARREPPPARRLPTGTRR